VGSSFFGAVATRYLVSGDYLPLAGFLAPFLGGIFQLKIIVCI